ncbi:hypothetical protein BSR29_00755 [Boudabousia liubingyangii]|uniref:DUF2304 domain-containing protein n=1 Tax=Boudabousia liubingyangii TaxID=1921764 RepID=A0A1Q5PPS6_9ACTO|nr:DUF2304 domain-containing protein [Boudabousia liubingyangii]OKL48451.1 hypothetical protein BSR28_01745 [Boudabousia liubingyangii]OKL49519.1 hypothetical protein BSR29_00755 [Boudabousia liubingyangii]
MLFAFSFASSGQIAIKILLLLGVALIAYFTLRVPHGQRSLATRRLTLIAFMFFAVFAIIWPSLVTKIASFLGVGRGADLVLYLLVIAFFANLATSYRRSLASEQKLTRLARNVALSDVIVPQDAAAGAEAPFGQINFFDSGSEQL